jgi:plastocyanin
MKIGRVLRIIAAIALLIGGLVHLQLYYAEGYRSAGEDANIGRSFLLNAISSAVVAALLFATKSVIVRVLGILVAAGTLLAFIITRTSDALFNFEESGLKPSPQATIALVVEIIAILSLAATFLPNVTDEDETRQSRVKLLGVGGGIAAITMVGLGVYWANSTDTTSVTPATPTSVSIHDFSFDPSDITVTVGSTVTWTNNDSVEHSLAADDSAFTSDPLSTGTTYQFTFDKAGTFPYSCGIHPTMHGTVTVTG